MTAAVWVRILTAVSGAAGTAIASGLLSGPAARWATIGIVALTGLASYLVPDKALPAVQSKVRSMKASRLARKGAETRKANAEPAKKATPAKPATRRPPAKQ